MTESKSVALPLGDTPKSCSVFVFAMVILSKKCVYGKRFKHALTTFFVFRQKKSLSPLILRFTFVILPKKEAAMLLSSLLIRPIFAAQKQKGFCVGVGISPKDYLIKYLFCSQTQTGKTEFALKFSCLNLTPESLHCSRLTPVLPKACIRIFLPRPLYNESGELLGQIVDGIVEKNRLTSLIVDSGERLPICFISAYADCVIVKKQARYPIGQRTSSLSPDCAKAFAVVTKSALKTAIKNNCLIKLTLSLPPFYFSEEAVTPHI